MSAVHEYGQRRLSLSRPQGYLRSVPATTHLLGFSPVQLGLALDLREWGSVCRGLDNRKKLPTPRNNDEIPFRSPLIAKLEGHRAGAMSTINFIGATAGIGHRFSASRKGYPTERHLPGAIVGNDSD